MIKPTCILKNGLWKHKYIVLVLFFILLAGVSFCDINKFVNAGLQAKWYWLYVGISICGLLSLFIGCRRKPDPITLLLILLYSYCLLRVINGQFILSFLSISALSFLIYYLASTIVPAQRFRYLAAAVVIVVFVQALYGIAQFIGLISRGNAFSVVGNFENPAGYASMLVFGTPFVLYFLNASYRPAGKYIAGGIFTTVGAAVILSGSRAGILAVIGISLLYLIKRTKTIWIRVALWKKAIALLLISIVLSGLYWVKKDSADGRMLIWRCTWDMIKEKPLFGHGYESFEAEYMEYQAHYFEHNPDSEYAHLADNVKHPFNEFLLLIAEFGLAAFILLGSLIIAIIRACLRHHNDEQFTLLLVLSAVCIFSCFSYPFKYPFTWLIVGVSLGTLSALSYPDNTQSNRPWLSRLFVVLLSILLFYITIHDIHYERRWFKAATEAATGQDRVCEYERLYPHFTGNAYFMYNYAVELNRTGRIDRSRKMISLCEERMNDYDVQMLKADNFKKTGDFCRAKASYVLALQMCPNRFMPLYGLVNVYDSLGQPETALKLAREIIDKPVKIPSGVVTAIKNRMRERIGQDGE